MLDTNQNLSVVALFDFDGTLTYRDSFAAFIRSSVPAWKLALGALLLLPSLVLYSLGRVDRQKMKERTLRMFFARCDHAKFSAKAEQFAQQRLDSLVRPEGISRIQWHKQQGHCCLLVSASIDSYLRPWAARHGFAEVLSSEIEIKGKRLTGRLAGANCWGPEKVRRVHTWLNGRSPTEVYAYGDSRGDKEMLELADQAFFRKLS